MAIFRRKQTTEIPELQEYYAARRANNSVGAWVLALVSLILTVLIILGLFFGGRWLWRTIRGEDDKPTTTTEQAADELEQGIDEIAGSDTDENDNNENNSAGNGGVTAPSSSSNSTGSTSNSGSSTSQSGVTGTSSTSTTTPSTGPAAVESLPNSGPGNVIAIFTTATVAGYTLHRRHQQKQN